jgi:hypothetical protein
MMNKLVVASIAALTLFALSADGGVVIAEQVVAPVSQAARYFVTPNDSHLIAIVPNGNQFVVKYDGVDGPIVDEVLNLSGLKYVEFDRGIAGVTDSPQKYIALSDDGNHFAYAARLGEEILIVADGKEVSRHPLATVTIRGLNFVPGRESIYYNIRNNREGRFDFQLVIDGAAGPALASEPQVRFSRDGSRYAYVAMRVEDNKQRYLIIDGKEAGYAAESPLFTGDGKKLASIFTADGNMTMQVDGKPVLTSPNIIQVFAAPAGDRLAVIAHSPAQRANVLFIDGAEVAGTQGVEEVKFSPDGKRYAALCRTPTSQRFYVIDGQPQKTYLGITDAQFSDDSSKFVYIGIDATGTNAVVVNDQESPGYVSLAMKPKFAAAGKRLAWVAVPQPGMNVLVVDDAQFEPVKGLLRFCFSAEGSRYAYLDTLPSIGKSTVTIDTLAQSDVIYSGNLNPAGFTDPNEASPVLFSPDGKQTAYAGAMVSNPNVQGLIVNGQFMKIADPPASRGTFTPDGKHLFFVTWNTPKYTVFLDGNPVGGWESNPVVHNAIDRAAANWTMGDDGTLTYLAAAGDQIKRIRITPDDQSSVETMLAQAKAAELQALEAAKALAEAQAKQVADERAASEKVAADARRAREDAMAEAKKAREDAAAAKKKAQEEAAAGKKPK